MLKILVIDEDMASNRKFEEIIKNKPQFTLTTVSSVEKATALIAPNFKKEEKLAAPPSTTPPEAVVPQAPPLKPDLIFVDISKIGGTPLQWFTEFREILKAGGIENVPIILLSLSSDPIFIRSFLTSGVHDVFVKPVVSTILETTLNYFNNGRKDQPKKVTPIKGLVEMYYQAVATEISEFEIKIATPKQISINDFKPIYGDFFKWSPERRVIARCTDCKKDEATKGSFLEVFSFVGVPPAITKEIRVWLKSQYVAQKQSGEQE